MDRKHRKRCKYNQNYLKTILFEKIHIGVFLTRILVSKSFKKCVYLLR